MNNRRHILFLVLLLLPIPPASGQSAAAKARGDAPRPVRRIDEVSSTAAEIQFFGFEFQRPYLGYEGPNYTRLEGEPSAGARYLVRAELFRQEAVASAKFEMIDERGRVTQLLRLTKFNNATDDGAYAGVVSVPPNPFRIKVSGRDINGGTYERFFSRLFRPSAQPPAPPLLPSDLPAERARQIGAALRAEEEQTIARYERELGLKHPDGVIQVPRLEVSGVTCEPLRSEKGNLLGMRLQYDIRYSADGDYAHSLRALPSYRTDDLRGLVEMEVIKESISPKPEPPSYATPQIYVDMNTLIKYGSEARYKSGVVYHYVVDLVPDFVGQNSTKTKFCIDNTHYRSKVKTQRSWEAMKARRTPLAYTVYLQRTNYIGETEPFDAPGAFYQGFIGEGAVECRPHKNIYF